MKPKVMIVEANEIILSIEKWRLSKLGFDVCGTAGCRVEAPRTSFYWPKQSAPIPSSKKPFDSNDLRSAIEMGLKKIALLKKYFKKSERSRGFHPATLALPTCDCSRKGNT